MKHAWGYGSRQRLREANEDCLGAFTLGDVTLGLVCDGMGGHHGGAHASALAVRVIHDVFRSAAAGADLKSTLRDAIQKANKAIYDASRKSHEFIGMGTTVAAVAVRGSTAVIAHVGDSRAYLVRRGSASVLTRDHTMVNLFVDAELLSPEDAASHPEAHVLSRSLGVERVVEVDFQEPMQLQDGDAILLCTDGVHGVLGEADLADAPWTGDAHAAVTTVLDDVEKLEGGDNASAVAIAVGTQVRSSAPPSELPPLDPQGGRTPRKVSPNAITAPGFTGRSLTDPGTTPRPFEHRPEVGAEDPTTLAARSPTPAPIGDPPVPQTPTAAAAPAPKAAAKKKKKKSARNARMGAALAVLVLGAVGTVVAGGSALAILLASRSKDAPAAAPAPAADAVADAETPDRTGLQPRATKAGTPEVKSRASAGELFFSPALPPIVPEVHRPQEHTHPPPGGTYQVEAVRAARAGKCSRSMETVVEAMDASIDFARLYLQAWECYTVRHREIVQTSEVEKIADFENLLVHFEGPLSAEAQEGPFEPTWDREASDGIEHRLAAYERSDPDRDLLADVMADYLGTSTLAAEIGRDVLLEAEAAHAFATGMLPEDASEMLADPRRQREYQALVAGLDEEHVDWWARRVYVTTRAMHGSIGLLLTENQPELAARITDTLQLALPGVDLDAPHLDDERQWPANLQVPDEVFRAYQAGLVDKVAPRPYRTAAAAQAAVMAGKSPPNPPVVPVKSTRTPRVSAPHIYRAEDQ